MVAGISVHWMPGDSKPDRALPSALHSLAICIVVLGGRKLYLSIDLSVIFVSVH